MKAVFCRLHSAMLASLRSLAAIGFSAGLLAALPASANVFTILLDTDRNAATGCSETLAVGATGGAEYRIDLAIGPPPAGTTGPTLTSLSYSRCDAATRVFGPATALPPNLLFGSNNGIDGSDVAELGVPLSALGLSTGQSIGVTVIGITASGGTVQSSVPAYTIGVGASATATAIPTLSEWGLLMLSLLLGLAAWRWMPRKAGHLAVFVFLVGWALVAWAANIVVDGQVDDWVGSSPVASNPRGSGPTPATEVRQLFIAEGAGNLYFRLDVTDLDAPPPMSVTTSVPATAQSGSVVNLGGLASGNVGTVSWNWAQLAGPAVRVSNASTANATFIAPEVTASTTLRFEVTASDSRGPVKQSVEVIVQPAGLYVTAGKDRRAAPGDFVSLHATGFGPGGSATYAWTQISPATPVLALTGAGTSNPTFTVPSLTQPTDFVLEVTFRDGARSASSRVRVKVPGPGTQGPPGGPLTVSGPEQRKPLVVATPFLGEVAGNATYTLGAAVSGGDGKYTWFWKEKGAPVGPGGKPTLGATNGQALRVTLPDVSGPTTYAFTVEVTDGSGNIASDSTTLFAKATPTPAQSPLTVATPPLTVNEGTVAPLSALASGGKAPYFYSWSQASGSAATLADATSATAHFTAPSVSADSALAFTVTVTDSAGGLAKSTASVTVRDVATPRPLEPLVLTAPPPQSVLGGASVNLPASALGGDGTYTFQWTKTAGPDVTLTGANTSRLTVATAAVPARTVFTFAVKVTDGRGSSASGSTQLTVDPLPALASLSVHGTPVTTFESNVTPLSASVAGGSPPYAYSWTQVSGTPAVTLTDASSPLASFTAPAVSADTPFAFKLEVTDSKGAKATGTVDVTVRDFAVIRPLEPLVVTVSPPPPVVGTAKTTIGATATGGDGNYGWAWTQTAGPSATVTGVTTPVISVTPQAVTARTTLTFEVTVTDGRSNTKKATASLTVDPAPALAPLAVSAANVTVNEGQVGLLTATASGGTAPYAYQWKTLAGNTSVIQNAGSNAASFTAPDVTSDTTLGFEVVVVDRAGATLTRQVDAVVRDVTAPRPNEPLLLAVPAAQTVLGGASVSLPASATGGDNAYTWTWTKTGGPDDVTLAGAATSRLTVGTATVSARTLYTFQVVVSDGTGKSKTGTTFVTVDPAPGIARLAVTGPNLQVNEGQTVALQAVATGGVPPYSYQWAQRTGNDAGLRDAATAHPSFTAPQVTADSAYEFGVAVTDGARSTANHVVTVTVRDVGVPRPVEPLVVSATPPLSGLSGASVTLTAVASGGEGAYRWQWSRDGTVVSGASGAQLALTLPAVTAPTTIAFEVVVTDGRGTTARQSTTVTVLPPPPSFPLDVFAPSVSASEGPVSAQLSASASGGKPPYTYAWVQTGTGPRVVITPGTGGNAFFPPPAIEQDTTLTFEVTARDSAGASVTKPVTAAIRNTFAIAPAQKLSLQPYDVPATGGGTVQLHVPYTGGKTPIGWAWRQVSGTAATISGQTTDTLTVSVPAVTAAEALVFSVTATDSNSPAETATAQVKVNVTPAPVVGTPPAPLKVTRPAEQRADETAAVTLTAPVSGGVPPYTYQWTYLKATNGPDITLSGANTARATFTAPIVSAQTGLAFKLRVADSAGASITLGEGTNPPVAVIVHDVGVTFQIRLENTNPIEATSGDTVSLTPGDARGGQGPYTYAWTQLAPTTPAITLTGGSTRNPRFTAPTVTADTIFKFGLTLRDSLGNVATTFETVTVKPIPAPSKPPLTLSAALDAKVLVNTTARLQLTPAGGTPPYSFTFASTPDFTFTTDPSGPNRYSFTTPGSPADISITATVTDADGDTTPFTVKGVVGFGECYTCGDYDSDPKRACSRIEIVTRHKEVCPAAKPYCMNDIFQAAGESPKLYKRCVDEAECKELWFMQSSDKVACFQYDSSTFRDDLVCHLCCFGDQCNANALPPNNTLYAP
jgi:hypothetical protein